MTLKKLMKTMIIPVYIGCIPLVYFAISEQALTAKYGDVAYSKLLSVGFVSIWIGCLTPVFIILWNMFGGNKRGFFFFWGRGKTAKGILKNGVSAVAEIISTNIRVKGQMLSINDQPVMNLYLLVHEENNQGFYVSVNTLISRTDIAYFERGKKFPVKFDPDDKDNVVFDRQKWQEMQVNQMRNEEWSDKDRQMVDKQGKNASATVISVTETEKSKNFQPVLKLVFLVEPDDDVPYRIEREFAVPEENLLTIRSSKGKTYNAKIHPEDKEKVSVEFTF